MSGARAEDEDGRTKESAVSSGLAESLSSVLTITVREDQHIRLSPEQVSSNHPFAGFHVELLAIDQDPKGLWAEAARLHLGIDWLEGVWLLSICSGAGEGHETPGGGPYLGRVFVSHDATSDCSSDGRSRTGQKCGKANRRPHTRGASLTDGLTCEKNNHDHANNTLTILPFQIFLQKCYLTQGWLAGAGAADAVCLGRPAQNEEVCGRQASSGQSPNSHCDRKY